MKKTARIVTAAAVLCAATSVFAGLAGVFRTAPTPAPISGDYVEARTASVFCGPCHYNGELMTTGRDALMAWRFDGGDYKGVSLKGIRAMAAVTAEENLSYVETPHKAQIVVDASATSEQVAAVVALLKEKCGPQLGSVASVTRATIAFTQDDAGYRVSAPGFAELQVSFRTDQGCCVQPQNVWYDPLAPISHRKVGFTESAAFTGEVAPPWSRTGEDSAFYGAIAF